MTPKAPDRLAEAVLVTHDIRGKNWRLMAR